MTVNIYEFKLAEAEQIRAGFDSMSAEEKRSSLLRLETIAYDFQEYANELYEFVEEKDIERYY